MKTYKKPHLPEFILYQGQKLVLNSQISAGMNMNNTSTKFIAKELRKAGRLAVLVLVLNPNLRGKTDLHGNPYTPTKFIFSN
jgi:hypothetical protein